MNDFAEFLAEAANRDDAVGDLARDLAKDDCLTNEHRHYAWRIVDHLVGIHGARMAAVESVWRAWEEFARLETV